MTKKREEQRKKLKYVFNNPNSPEETEKMLVKIIVKHLLRKTGFDDSLYTIE